MIQQAIKERPQALVNIDAIGVGASAFDCCKELRAMNVMAIIFSNKTESRDVTGVLRSVNVRAYAYWRLRDMLDTERGENIALPPDQELLSDLTAPRWAMTMQGIKVEPKEDIVKRLGRSPDCADAVVLAILRPPVYNVSGPERLVAK